MDTLDKLEILRKRFGSWAAVARELGVSYQAVWSWRKGQEPVYSRVKLIDLLLKEK